MKPSDEIITLGIINVNYSRAGHGYFWCTIIYITLSKPTHAQTHLHIHFSFKCPLTSNM